MVRTTSSPVQSDESDRVPPRQGVDVFNQVGTFTVNHGNVSTEAVNHCESPGNHLTTWNSIPCWFSALRISSVGYAVFQGTDVDNPI
jgi:hypothetical protein